MQLIEVEQISLKPKFFEKPHTTKARRTSIKNILKKRSTRRKISVRKNNFISNYSAAKESFYISERKPLSKSNRFSNFQKLN